MGKTKGFTLVELLVVIAIIGILASIAVPSMLRYREQAWDAVAMQDLRRLMATEELAYIETNKYMTIGELRFEPSDGVTVEVSLIEPDTYVAVSYHNRSKSAFKVSNDTMKVSKVSRSELGVETK